MSTENRLSCRDFIEFLDDYIDEQLPAQRRNTFEAHLSVCVACKDYLHSYRRTIGLAANVGQLERVVEEAPVDLVEAIIRAQGTK